MSSWSLMPLIPLFEALPGTRIFFALFYVYAGWTLLAVMTGTVSFTMIAIKAQIVSEDEGRVAERKAGVQTVLRDIFEKLDEDGSGALDYDEFQAIVTSSEVLWLLSNSTDVKVQDLQDIWTWLDDDGSGEVSVEEFLQMFQWLNEPFKPKTLMRLQERLARDVRNLKKKLEDLVLERFEAIMSQVQAPISKIHAVTEQVQVLTASLTRVISSFEIYESQSAQDRIGVGSARARGMTNWDEDPPSEPTVAHFELQALEKSVSAQIEEVMERLSRFEATPRKELRRASIQAGVHKQAPKAVAKKAAIRFR